MCRKKLICVLSKAEREVQSKISEYYQLDAFKEEVCQYCQTHREEACQHKSVPAAKERESVLT
jgi:hypothetical protein